MCIFLLVTFNHLVSSETLNLLFASNANTNRSRWKWGEFKLLYFVSSFLTFGVWMLFLCFLLPFCNVSILTIFSSPLSSTGKLLAREEARSGSLNNLHVFPTGSYIKPSRGTGRSESFGGSGRSSRSSSIASDRSGSLNSIPGSVTSVESR